jgi:L-aspartate oxidase
MRRYITSFRSRDLPHRFTDCLVIGSGVAGLRAALEVAKLGTVTLVTKGGLSDSNSAWAQGGVAAVMGEEDSPEKHIKDTLQAGAGLSHEDVCRTVIEAGPAMIRDLQSFGTRFDREEGALALTREGGHSEKRVVHAGGDATGREIVKALRAAIVASPEIRVLESSFVIDLIDTEGRCSGALLLRQQTSEMEVIWAKATVLATGGAGRIWRETTNPDVATGDGLALGLRAGAVLRDLEFMQFHPTTLYLAGAARALITEAVRGEGAYLRDRDGVRFMPDVHPQAELAPRDVVSLAIVDRMARSGATRVFLDLSHLDPSRIRKRFPGITSLLRAFDMDITKDPIPVRPSAHYMVGGIRVDTAGRTSLPGLFACGEVASSGLHGANRLGSNSILEAAVLGVRVGQVAGEEARTLPLDYRVPEIDSSIENRHGVSIDIEDVENSLRSLMWRLVGVRRDGKDLEQAHQSLAFWARYVLGNDLRGRRGYELQNRLTVSLLVTEMALRREESRGVHFRADYPDRDDAAWPRHQEAHLGPDGTPTILDAPGPGEYNPPSPPDV